MKFEKLKLVYFSPTGTTKSVLEGIAGGIEAAVTESVDLTPPAADSTEIDVFAADEPVVFGVPVYGGRVPLIALERLRNIKGRGTPAVIVVVYGNRLYEDALLELKNAVVEAGFTPVAGGGFVGEHSFSSDESPIAAGRPDEQDILAAKSFGIRVRNLLDTLDISVELPELDVPGNFPHRDRGGIFPFAPDVDEALCAHCGSCSAVCPVGAISIDKSVQTDAGSCILCYACMKNCTTGARVMNNPKIPEIAAMMSVKFAQRRKPDTYLCSF